MPGPIACECGQVLVQEVTQEGILPAGGDRMIPFRRQSDMLVCAHCMRDYNVHGLIDLARDPEIIALLERMIEPPAAWPRR